MATVLEFTCHLDAFPFGSLFESQSAATVEIERIVPHLNHMVPYLWIRGIDVDDPTTLLEPHPGLIDAQFVDRVGDESLLRVEWAGEEPGILTGLAESDVTLLTAKGSSRGWRFEVRGETRDAIADFRDYCTAEHIQIDVVAVHALVPSTDDLHFGLTNAQREAIILAYERGYFDTPRRATLDEIAAELDITQQSLSSRLRRGYRRLVAGTLVPPPQ